MQRVGRPAGGRGRRFWPSAWPSWAWLLLSGLFLGLSVHFYSISRLYPVFLGLFLVAQAAVSWIQNPRSKSWFRESLLGRLGWQVAGLYAVAAVVFAPLGWYFLTHPGTFTERASVVSAFGNQAAPWATIGRAIVGNVAQFFLPGHGDTKRFYNLPGRAVLEPVTAVLAILGVLICLRRWKRPPYLLILLWWPIMLLPTFFAVDRIPTAWRAMGVMPALYFFPAIAIGTGVDWLRSRRLPACLRRLAIASLLIVPLGVAAVWTGRDYMTWAALPGTYEAFEGDVVEAARWLKANPQPWPVYVSSDLYRHLSFLFLYSQTPTSQFFTVHDEAVRWFDGRSALPLPPDTGEATYLFTGSAQTGDEWLDRYLPDRQVVYQSLDPAGKPSLTVVRARYHDRREIEAAVSPVDGIALTGYGVYGQAQPGSPMQVALHWRFAGPQPERGGGLRVQVALLDDRGRQWATVEQPLEYRPQEWDAGSRAVSWYQIVLPGEAPKAAYRVAVRLVDGQTAAPLGDWATLAPSEQMENPPTQQLVTFGTTLRLLAANARVEKVAGGEQVVAELAFDTTAPQPWSYTLFMHVLDANDQKAAQRDTSTGNGLYPTDAWQPGQPVQDVYRIPIDAAGAQQPYRLAVGFYDWRTGERLPAVDREGRRLPEDRFLVEVEPSP